MKLTKNACRACLSMLLLASCAGQAPSGKRAGVEPPSPTPEVMRLFDEAVAFKQAEESAEARAKLDAVIKASPGFALAHLERAQLLVDSGEEAPLALLDARMAAQSLGDNPRAQMLLGRLLEDSGDDAGAAEAYRRSVALRSDVALSRRLAIVLGRAGKMQESIEVWEVLREQSPDDVGARLALAQSYEKVDRPASAETEWMKVTSLAASNAHLLRQFADFLTRQGKLLEAREINARADELDAPQEQRELRPLLPSKR